jgi:MFS family permease
MGAYSLFLFGSNFIAPIIAGFIDDGQGWQWVLYWSAIIPGIGFIICFFFMEETNFYGRGTELDTAAGASTDAVTTPPISLHSDSKNTELNSDSEAPSLGQAYTMKTFWQKLALIDRQPNRPKNIFLMMYRPILLLRFPVLLFSGFQYGLTLVMFNIMNATASSILGSSPYNFRASMVGLCYFAPLIGAFIGAFYTGWFGDKIGLWFARRNKGIREPEHKLWLFNVSLILVPSALILWGVGAYHHVHWFGLLFGMGMLGSTNAIGATTAINYAVDSYKDLSGEGMVTVILIRNTMSFAIGYGITPWMANTGLQNTFIAAAFIGLGFTATFFIMIKWGRHFRLSSREAYWKYVETSVLAGH